MTTVASPTTTDDGTPIARTLHRVAGHSRLDGVVPGVRGQRSLPTRELRQLDPFVMLDHIGPETLPVDFYVDGQMHPHRGFETLTMMFEGVMHHVDSSGFREDLLSGSTQNMLAGSGIQHGGDMAADPETHRFHEVQLWVNMPAATKMRPPAIHSAHAGDTPILHRGQYDIEVISGTIDGVTSPLSTTQPTTVARVQASGIGPITIDGIASNWNVAVYVLQGAVEIDATPIVQFQTAVLGNDGGRVELDVRSPGTDLLVIAGEPIDEPVVMGGPFVMNTADEIAQAEADFVAGHFDNVDLASDTDNTVG